MLAQSRFVSSPPESTGYLHVPPKFLEPERSSSESSSSSESEPSSARAPVRNVDDLYADAAPDLNFFASHAPEPPKKRQRHEKEPKFIPFSRQFAGDLCYSNLKDVYVVPSLSSAPELPSHALMLQLAVDAERTFEQRALKPSVTAPDPDRAFLKEMKGVVLSNELRELLFAPSIRTEENEYNIDFAIAEMFRSGVPEYNALPKYEQRKDRAFIGVDKPWIKKQFRLMPQMRLSIHDYSRMVHVLRAVVTYAVYGTLRSSAAQHHSDFDLKWLASRWDQLVELTQREVNDTVTNEPRLTSKGHVITQSALQFLPRIMALYRLVRRLDSESNNLSGMVNDLDKETVKEITATEEAPADEKPDNSAATQTTQPDPLSSSSDSSSSSD